MNEDTKEIILLLVQRAQDTPIRFASSVLGFMLGLYGIASAILLYSASSMDISPFLTVPIVPISVVIFATYVTIFTLFFTLDVMEKSKKLTIWSFISRAAHGVDYGFVIHVIKFTLLQIVITIPLVYMAGTIYQIFIPTASTELSTAQHAVDSFINLLALIVLCILFSVLAFSGILKAYIHGIGASSSASYFFLYIITRYKRPLLHFTSFNALVFLCVYLHGSLGWSAILTMTITLVQAVGVIRHFMGDKPEKKAKESINLAFNN